MEWVEWCWLMSWNCGEEVLMLYIQQCQERINLFVLNKPYFSFPKLKMKIRMCENDSNLFANLFSFEFGLI